MSDHRCAHPACEAAIPLHHFACHDHWYALPKRLRMGLDRTWRNLEGTGPGNEAATVEYRRFVMMAVTYWRNKPSLGRAAKEK